MLQFFICYYEVTRPQLIFMFCKPTFLYHFVPFVKSWFYLSIDISFLGFYMQSMLLFETGIKYFLEKIGFLRKSLVEKYLVPSGIVHRWQRLQTEMFAKMHEFIS